MKPFIRVLGIDDAAFKPKTRGKTLLVGVLFRLDNRVEGILTRNVSIDGLDSTKKIIGMVKESKFREQVSVILLDGVNFAGFNIVDFEKLFAETRVPTIAVFRKRPNMEKIEAALNKFRDGKKRLELIKKAGSIHSFNSINFQCIGIDARGARKLLKKTIYFSSLPEPVRLAHLIASGVSLQQSTHP